MVALRSRSGFAMAVSLAAMMCTATAFAPQGAATTGRGNDFVNCMVSKGVPAPPESAPSSSGSSAPSTSSEPSGSGSHSASAPPSSSAQPSKSQSPWLMSGEPAPGENMAPSAGGASQAPPGINQDVWNKALEACSSN